MSSKGQSLNHPYPEAILDTQKKLQIMQLRVAGWAVWQIAEHLGIAITNVHNHIFDQLSSWRDMTQEMSNELRELEVQRLDEFLRALWPKIQSGNPRAIETALKVSERRAKLLGLDAPEKREVTVDASVQSLTHTELVSEYARLGLPLTNEQEILSYQLPAHDAKQLTRRIAENSKSEDDA